VTDHILLEVDADEIVKDAIRLFESYITSETLGELKIVTNLSDSDVTENELVENVSAKIRISKVK
jgi:hypothetical protein